MQYELNNILPSPLMEQKKNRQSAIWETHCVFEKGKKYLVSAPSGKGKSTLLHILYGLRKDFEGSLKLNDNSLSAIPVNDWADMRKNQLAIIFQDLRLFPKLNALDNILIKNNLTGIKSEEDIIKMAKKLGIDHLLHQTCETLSYGQRQRVAIIRALCQPFDFLLLDEPFSHLDESNAEKAFQLIESVCAEQKAGYILVSLGEKYGREYDMELIV